ncbi:copper resistance protein CopC [Micromonospora fulviviridis]|uniref:copper resistance protein CopC n=1 Tax=Micromonospora fulviviridis TaxID=47860 RepID=UPI00379B30FB
MPPHRRHPAVARVLAATLAALAFLLASAAPAAAHNSLRTASPSADARLTAPPAEVSLEFLQNLDPAFTTVVLSDGARRKVPTGDPVVTGSRARVPIGGTLPNGTYTVAYRVVSADGHPVQGSYTFTVADPTSSAAPATPTAAVAATSTNTASDPAADETRPPWLPIVGGTLAAVAVGAVVLSRRRRG